MHAAHPLGVAFGQVVVDGDDVHALTGQRVEVRRQHAGQGLALTGLHLGDVAEVQRRAAHDLNIERSLVKHTPSRLTGHRERFGQQVVEGGAVGDALLEFVGLGPQFGVGELRDVVGQGVDVVSHPLEALDHAAFAETQQLIQHAISPMGWNRKAQPHGRRRGAPPGRTASGQGKQRPAPIRPAGSGQPDQASRIRP